MSVARPTIGQVNVAATFGTVGTWVGSVGTAGTLGWLVFDKYRTDSEARESKRRRYAERMSAWLQSPPGSEHSVRGTVVVSNGSHEPSYNVVVLYVWIQGAAWRTGEEAVGYTNRTEAVQPNQIWKMLSTVPPGRWTVTLAGPPDGPMQGRLGVEVAFTDAGGRHWIRRATGGSLVEIERNPLEHYGIGGPHVYAPLVAADV